MTPEEFKLALRIGVPMTELEANVLVDGMLKRYAHKLAEKQRALRGRCPCDCISAITDLIDPMAMSSEHESTPDGESGGGNDEVHDEGQQAGHDEPHPKGA